MPEPEDKTDEVEALKKELESLKTENEKLQAKVVPPNNQEKLDPNEKKAITEQKPTKPEADPDLVILKQRAIIDLIKDFSDDQQQKLTPLFAGKNLKECTDIVEAIKAIAPKPGAVGGLPAPHSGESKKPGYFDDGYEHVFIDNRVK